jgi:archaellum biogenesis protein FlaJ (TadC family)
MYLETIFCAEDIQKQLPVEAQKFMAVDKFWKATMKKTNENKKVMIIMMMVLVLVVVVVVMMMTPRRRGGE